MAEQRGAAIEFDPYVPGSDDDTYPVVARFREKAPVVSCEQGRAWLVVRREDVVSLLRASTFEIPKRHDASFRRFADAIHRLSEAARPSLEESGKLEAALDVGIAVASGTVEERRRRPLGNDVLMLLIQAEEQGEAAYPCASSLDLRRGADAGVAFGGGAHYCIGDAGSPRGADRHRDARQPLSRDGARGAGGVRSAPLDPEDDLVTRPPPPRPCMKADADTPAPATRRRQIFLGKRDAAARPRERCARSITCARKM
jgi:cytochrome P450